MCIRDRQQQQRWRAGCDPVTSAASQRASERARDVGSIQQAAEIYRIVVVIISMQSASQRVSRDESHSRLSAPRINAQPDTCLYCSALIISPPYGRGALSNAAVRLSVCPISDPMPEIEPIRQRGRCGHPILPKRQRSRCLHRFRSIR